MSSIVTLAVCRQCPAISGGARHGANALRHAATAARWRPAGNEHPQHVVAALARLAEPGNRCLVPINRFAEYAPEPNGNEEEGRRWFALNEDRPLFTFAGIWNTFKGDRGTKSKQIPGPHQVYGFLTMTPNAVVQPIHPKAMPVILTIDEEPYVRPRRSSCRCRMAP